MREKTVDFQGFREEAPKKLSVFVQIVFDFF